ncbi:hypothetical protein ACFPK9_09155 [Rubritalea spongiae]|uniref:Uncharacterized protein n=1 Tax=Rubritalea spongiae TaxID=430797 RepID=A0ABW5E1Y3_9BACT
MNKLPIPFSILALSISPVIAEVAAPVSAAATGEEKAIPMTIEDREASVVSLEAYIEERDARLEEVTEDVLRIDNRMQGKIDTVVKKLASLSDSKNSKYRVSQEKIRVMKGLVKNLEEYQSKRAGLIRELRKDDPNVPKDAIKKDVERNNELTEKRIEQVLMLSKSFTQEDPKIKKYTNSGSGGWDRWGNWNTNERISDAYKQNRRDKSMDKKQRDAIEKALDEAITRNESRVNGMVERLKDPNLTPESKELMESELAHYQEVLETRKRQKADFVLVDKPKTKPISQHAAMDIEKALDDAIHDLRDDMYHVKQKYAELREEQKVIQKLTVQLEARKKWLADYEEGKVKLPTE